jgi:hypothetical protein
MGGGCEKKRAQGEPASCLISTRSSKNGCQSSTNTPQRTEFLGNWGGRFEVVSCTKYGPFFPSYSQGASNPIRDILTLEQKLKQSLGKERQIEVFEVISVSGLLFNYVR